MVTHTDLRSGIPPKTELLITNSNIVETYPELFHDFYNNLRKRDLQK